MCHATSAGRKAGSVSKKKSQFVDTLSTNKAYLFITYIFGNCCEHYYMYSSIDCFRQCNESYIINSTVYY